MRKELQYKIYTALPVCSTRGTVLDDLHRLYSIELTDCVHSICQNKKKCTCYVFVPNRRRKVPSYSGRTLDSYNVN